MSDAIHDSGRLVLFHLDPQRDDTDIEAIRDWVIQPCPADRVDQEHGAFGLAGSSRRARRANSDVSRPFTARQQGAGWEFTQSDRANGGSHEETEALLGI